MNYTSNSKMTRNSSMKCLQFATPKSGELEQKYKRLAVEIQKIKLQANMSPGLDKYVAVTNIAIAIAEGVICSLRAS